LARPCLKETGPAKWAFGSRPRAHAPRIFLRKELNRLTRADRPSRTATQVESLSVQYSDYKCFQLRFDSGVAFVSINHPPINLLDDVLSQEFDNLGKELEADESVRVVVVQSALPDFFIAHSGLGRVGAASKTVSRTRSFRLTQMIGERFRNMPKVTIAKIEGRARGGGSEIALAMDMCFAAVGRAIFGQPEVAVGLVPGGGSTQRLPRLMGRGRALEVLLGCNDFSAVLAERYGYINRALPADELTPFVEKLARRIASFPAHTIAHAKAAVDKGAFSSIAEGLLIEANESNLSVASEITQARVAEAMRVGAETYEGELDMAFISRLSSPR
jgi:enoyl-CoA hydratase/carnithine racemase